MDYEGTPAKLPGIWPAGRRMGRWYFREARGRRAGTGRFCSGRNEGRGHNTGGRCPGFGDATQARRPTCSFASWRIPNGRIERGGGIMRGIIEFANEVAHVAGNLSAAMRGWAGESVRVWSTWLALMDLMKNGAGTWPTSFRGSGQDSLIRRFVSNAAQWRDRIMSVREIGFIGESIQLADGSPGAVVKTSPQCARPAPGRTVLLTADANTRIATIAAVLVEAPGCDATVSVVSLQSESEAV